MISMECVKKVLWRVSLALLVATGSGCATAVMTGAGGDARDPGSGRTAAGARADGEISSAVIRALVHDPRIPAMPIRVRTDRGRVTLSGEVPDRETARRAARVAAGVPGVESVRNLLRVEYR